MNAYDDASTLWAEVYALGYNVFYQSHTSLKKHGGKDFFTVSIIKRGEAADHPLMTSPEVVGSPFDASANHTPIGALQVVALCRRFLKAL